MAIQIKSLVDGEMQTTTNDLLPAVDEGKTVIVKNMRFVNTGGDEATLNVYFSDGTNSRRILPKDLKLSAGQLLIDDNELTLEEDDKIEGSATGSTVDFVISGIERDV